MRRRGMRKRTKKLFGLGPVQSLTQIHLTSRMKRNRLSHENFIFRWFTEVSWAHSSRTGTMRSFEIIFDARRSQRVHWWIFNVRCAGHQRGHHEFSKWRCGAIPFATNEMRKMCGFAAFAAPFYGVDENDYILWLALCVVEKFQWSVGGRGDPV